MAQKPRRTPTVLWKNLRTPVKQLRTEPTLAENRLWQMLRGRQLCGYKFRRQHALDRFVVDFCCPQANLIIEVDGPIHETQLSEDQERQKILEQMGFQVIRFTNDQVLNHLDQVLDTIVHHLTHR